MGHNAAGGGGLPPISPGVTQSAAGLLSLAPRATSFSESAYDVAVGAGITAQRREMGGRVSAGHTALALRAAVATKQ